MDAYFNSDLGWGRILFSREEVLTSKLIDKTKGQLVEQCLIKVWHLIGEIWQLSSYVMTWSWNFHEKLSLNKWNWLATIIFVFVVVIKIQFWSVLTDRSTIFIPQQIWKLMWLVCTLKYTQVTNQNDEVDNPFSYWGPLCELTLKQIWKQIL